MSSTLKNTPNSSYKSKKSKKTRLNRARRRVGRLESDEEIEREAGTDSDSEESVLTDSASSNGSETQVTIAVNSEVLNKSGPFTTSKAVDWSEMVSDEKDKGPSELTVVDFAEFSAGPQRILGKPKKPLKAKKVVRVDPVTAMPSPPASSDEQDAIAQPEASSSLRRESVMLPKREPGQTVRQAYQQRLDKDPSYVPTVGQFWGHDDRLLDRGLRSLSGWWRGRWEGGFARGRGTFSRGFARGRGRGGFTGPAAPGHMHNHSQNTVPATASSDAQPDLDVTSKPWTHDGFEEMKEREERRRQATAASTAVRGGTITSRGRGTVSVNKTRIKSQLFVGAPQQGRTWYAMKPERVWTKDLDTFLYLDPALKARSGHGSGVRISLPGGHRSPQTIRLPLASATPKVAHSKATSLSVSGLEENHSIYVVRLPTHSPEIASQEDQTAEDVELQITPGAPASVREGHSLQKPEPVVADFPAKLREPEDTHQLASSQVGNISTPPVLPLDQAGWIQPEISVPTHGTQVIQSEPQLSRQLFTPVQQSSPAYGYPYGAVLPPGIAMDQSGVTYEVATGRPVYFHNPSLYTPPTIIHTPMLQASLPFVPGHLPQVSSASPDYANISGPSSSNGYSDPPLFVRPRVSSRIEIRAPTEANLQTKAPRQTSHLRTEAISFQPSQSDNHFYASEGSQQQYAEHTRYSSPHPQDPGMLQYLPYPQQYYYPEPQYAYRYMEQQQHYEMYPTEVQYQ